MNKHSEINKVLKDFFENNPNIHKIAAKELMPNFITAGIFSKDIKGGLPIRSLLRKLDASNSLHLIPYVFAQRNTANTNWFFQRTKGAVIAPKPNKVVSEKVIKINVKVSKNRDEDYVLNLCDEVLNLKGSRQHKFDFLVGDSGRKLPVDIYYSTLNLVVEYRETQHSNEVKFFDKPEKMTVSGVSRGEQRKIYDQRRRDVLSENEIKLVEIDYSDFKHDKKNRIIRDKEKDLEVVKGKLKQVIF